MPHYLTVRETAELLRLSERTVRNKIYAGVFVKGRHYVRQPGIGVRFKREVLIAWLEGAEPIADPKTAAEEQDAGRVAMIPMARGYKI